MMIKYFKDIDILNIELHKVKFEYSEEIADGVIFDISQEDEILSIEVLDVAKKFRKPAEELGFREVCGKSSPDYDLNRAPGFALQLAVAAPADPRSTNLLPQGSLTPHRPIIHTSESRLLAVPSNSDTSSQ